MPNTPEHPPGDAPQEHEHETHVPEDELADTAIHQQDESDAVGATPTLPVLPREMGRGMVSGIVIGGVIGAIVLAPLAFFSMGELSFIARLAIVALIGAVAGSAAGAVFLAGATAELTDDDEHTGDPSMVPRHDKRGSTGQQR